MLRTHDVVRIFGLQHPEDEYNGALAICISDIYTHPKYDKIVVRIKIGDSLWAIETKNVTKVTDVEKDDYIRSQDGNQIVMWSGCHWRPKINNEPDFNI